MENDDTDGREQKFRCEKMGFNDEVSSKKKEKEKEEIGGDGLGGETTLLMYDGSFKKVADISTGDEIMGDDSKPRTVHSINIYKNRPLYRIHPGFGVPFLCTFEHLLILRYTQEPYIIHNKTKKSYELHYENHGEKIVESCSYNNVSIHNEKECCHIIHDKKNKLQEGIDFSFVNHFQITVKNYLELPKYKKKRMYAYFTGVNFRKNNNFPVERNRFIKYYADHESRYHLLKNITSSSFPDKGNLDLNVSPGDYDDDEIQCLARSCGLEYCKKAKVPINGLAKIGVYSLEPGDAYRFELDGNKRFLLSDFTVTKFSCSQ